MPSTATTNVTISTILDLIGPTQSSPSGDDSQPGFDSVLNSSPPAPRSPPPPTEQPQRADDQRPAKADCRDNNSRPIESANSKSSDDSAEHNPSNTTDAAAQADTAAGHRDEKQSESPAEETDDVQQLIAQSLAGISAATAKVPPQVATPAAEDTAKTTDELATSEGKSKATPAASRPSQKVASQAQTGDSQAVLPAREVTIASAEDQAAKPNSEKAATSQESAAVEAAKPKSDAKLTQSEPIASTDKPAEAPEATVESSLNNDKSSHSSHQESSSEDKPQATNLDPTAVTTPTPDSTSAANSNAQTPIIAAVTTAAIADNQPATTETASQSQTTGVTASGPRSRLPAQALAPATATNNRRPTVEVDSGRLLTRVVRAFSAAQDRDGEVHLRLAPPELGSLRLDIRVENGALTAHMQTETDAARTAIIDNLPALRERLAEQGVRIERFDVDLMQRQTGGMPDQQSGRQPESPEPTPRFVQPARASSAAAAASSVASVSVGSTSGLNVIV